MIRSARRDGGQRRLMRFWGRLWGGLGKVGGEGGVGVVLMGRGLGLRCGLMDFLGGILPREKVRF